MAQSTTNLGKIHVFPSETLYNQFKDIIADNDLALLKDDGAYIVAALLEQLNELPNYNLNGGKNA